MVHQTDARGMRENERADLAALGRRHGYAAGTPLCHEGDVANDVYLIETGSVRVVRSSANGREIILATRRPGDLVGELSAFDGERRSAAIIANESSTVCIVPSSAFRQLVVSRPRLAELFLRELALKVRDADERTLERDSDDVRTRLAARLMALADEQAPDAAGPVTVRVRQAELAAWVGASRETVARVLSDLRANDLITTGRGTIELLDLPALRRPALY